MAHPQDHFETINGLRLHYLDWGTPGKQPLILLHGGSAYAQWWDFFAPAFTDNFHVIAPDWRGHGESQHTEPPAYSSRHYIDDLHKLLVKIGIERPVVLGHSMGGHNAVIYATEYAAEMAALVMVDTNVSYPESAVQFLRKIGEKPAKVFDSFAEAKSRFRVLPRESLFSKERLEYIASFAFKEREDGKWTSKLDRRTLFRDPVDGRELLSKITCPSLIVKAENSPVLNQEKLERICSGLPNGRWAEVKDCYHHIMLDNPEGLIEVVQEFLGEVVPGR
jgi:pimeloyl-ACP methyl ester carboxylesterase